MPQDALPGMTRRARTRPAGRVERAVSADMVAARRRDELPPSTAGLAALARVTGRLLDDVERDTESSPGSRAYAHGQAAKVLGDVYDALGLTSKGDTGDDAAIRAWLDGLGSPTVSD
jgi:hypothetical protein